MAKIIMACLHSGLTAEGGEVRNHQFCIIDIVKQVYEKVKCCMVSFNK